MKKLLFTTITSFLFLTVFGQNGINSGNLFVLLKNKTTISINSFEDNKIKELKSFPITKGTIYTTDQKTKVVTIDTAKNVTLFDLQTANEIKLPIPFKIYPKTVLLNEKNLFIGGEMDNEMLIQYNLQNNQWYQLEIPKTINYYGKAIDDLVINDTLLIAIDNILTPKYIVFYRLVDSNEKLTLSHIKELNSNGAYESIQQGKITEKYFGLLSSTMSGYIGATNHITIYNNLELGNNFSISSNQRDKDYHTFTDFLIVKDKIIIASKKKGLGIFEIKESYFKNFDKYGNKEFHSRQGTPKIKYTNNRNATILKLTIIPNSEKIILTLENKQGVIKHEIVDISNK